MRRDHRAWAGWAPLLGLVAAACGGSEAKEPEAAAPNADLRRVVNVEVQAAETAPFTDVVTIIGVITANRDVTVAAEEGGVIRALYVERGAALRAGQPIAKVDDALLRAQVSQSRADAELARETYERQRRLWEEEKIGTEMAYLQAKFAAERTAANLELLTERLERTTIRSPVAGVLDARMVEVGSMVATGTPVARVIDISSLKVEGGVPERFAPEIRPGLPARIVLDGVEHRQLEGRISFVGTAINDQDRTFPVEAVLRNPGTVKPGMVANVAIAHRTLELAVVVPLEAVLRAADGYIVYVAVERDGVVVAEQRPVVTGPSQGGQVVIESGVSAGDQVIVVGQQQVAPGDRLQIVRRKGGVAQ